MARIARMFSGLLLFGLLTGCAPQVELDQATFNRYIKAMQNIQQTYPDLARKLQTAGSSALKERDAEKVERNLHQLRDLFS